MALTQESLHAVAVAAVAAETSSVVLKVAAAVVDVRAAEGYWQQSFAQSAVAGTGALVLDPNVKEHGPVQDRQVPLFQRLVAFHPSLVHLE